MKDIQDPFVIKDNLGKVKGFSRIKDEGNNLWLGKFSEQLGLGIERGKIVAAFWVLVVLVVVMLARLAWLQIYLGDDFSIMAEGNRIRVYPLIAERGIIYDRFGIALVKNIPSMSVYFVPADLPSSASERLNLAGQLSTIIGKNSAEIMALFEETDAMSYKQVLLEDDLKHNEVVLFTVLDAQLPGIFLKTETSRQYLEGSALAHVLGYVGRIDADAIAKEKNYDYRLDALVGKDGVEYYYENILRGNDGKQEIEVDAQGKSKKILNEVKAVSGDSLVLTIDHDLQKKMTESMEKAIKECASSHAGVAIALDPRNGEVLALVSLPNFDNNFFSSGIDQNAYVNYLTDDGKPLFNRAISGSYPPGSTFKPIVALAALEQGIVDENKTFLSSGGIELNKWFFPDWKYGGHGRTNIIKALSESVNTYFYYIGGGYNDFEGLGVARITEYAHLFSLGRKLGIDLPGEASGFLPSKEWKIETKNESWYIGDTYHLAIGQGDILVTPLQIASYMSVIANGGTLYQPHVMKSLMSNSQNNGRILAGDDYIISQDFISRENIDIVRRGLRETVKSGSARSLSNLTVVSAGKTGTAQVGGDKESHAWFAVFAPYESPQIVILILLENGGEGSTAAVPVAKDVLEWYFRQ